MLPRHASCRGAPHQATARLDAVGLRKTVQPAPWLVQAEPVPLHILSEAKRPRIHDCGRNLCTRALLARPDDLLHNLPGGVGRSASGHHLRDVDQFECQLPFPSSNIKHPGAASK